MSKRILVISQHYWPENFRISDICKGFCEKDIEVDVLCGLPNYPDGILFDGYKYFSSRRQTHDGVNIYRTGEILRKGNTGLRIFLNYISYPFFASFKLLRFIGKKYDAVFSYETSPVLMAFPAIVYSKLHKVPHTMYVLDLWPENLYSVLDVQNKALRKIAEKVSHWHYKKADKLIAMSPSLQKRLMDITGKSEDKIDVIPQYCEELYENDVFDEELAKRFGDKFNVVFAGNVSPAQGLDALVECAIRLKKDCITDIRFIIVGTGMSLEALKQSCVQNNVEEYFAFEGMHPVTDVPKYHTIANALFAALKQSGDIGLTIPAKVTSYIAAARPVLCSMDGEGALAIEKAQCGFTSKAGDTAALYDNLLKLYNMSEEQRKRLGENGRSYHNANFKRGKVLNRLIAFIFND